MLHPHRASRPVCHRFRPCARLPARTLVQNCPGAADDCAGHDSSPTEVPHQQILLITKPAHETPMALQFAQGGGVARSNAKLYLPRLGIYCCVLGTSLGCGFSGTATKRPGRRSCSLVLTLPSYGSRERREIELVANCVSRNWIASARPGDSGSGRTGALSVQQGYPAWTSEIIHSLPARRNLVVAASAHMCRPPPCVLSIGRHIHKAQAFEQQLPARAPPTVHQQRRHIAL